MSAENGGPVRRGLRRLLHSIRGRGNNNSKSTTENEEGDAHPLPFLPAQRPRPLTPTASQQSPATLGTLARLPPELRRRILITAFGSRTLHLDLQFAHPRRADAVDAALADLSHSSGPGHGLGASPSGYYYFGDRDAPQAWRWTSCVCHRLVPPGSQWEQRFLEKGCPTYRYPHTDQCLEGNAHFCWMWPGPPTGKPGQSGYAPGKCMVGAMGWLLACRQAYAEGIDVLYSTNTFFVEGDALLSNLVCPDPAVVDTTRHLILPQRLERITSLELRWELLLFGPPYRPYRRREYNAAEDRALLAAHLRHLCDPFPNLRKLVLSFSDPLYNDARVRPRDALDEIERVLLRPLADAVARLPLPLRQEGVLVELPSNVFQDLGGLGLEGEAKGYEVGDEKGVWLRYPLSRRHLAESVQSSQSASEPGNGSDGFYYIKQGEESDLFWNWKGEPQSHAALNALQRCFGTGY
jgi:hypothetical protein